MTKDEVAKKNKKIWEMYSCLECLEEQCDEVFKGLESMILSSFVTASAVPYHVRDGISFLFANKELDLHTHTLSIYMENCSNYRGGKIYGDIPAIVVGFSKISLEYDEISSRDLEVRNNGEPIFRGRITQKDDQTCFTGDSPQDWDMRCSGRLIWNKKSVNSVDHAAWYFVLPLAAVDSLEAAKEMIVEPLKVLLKGIDPKLTCIPFSEHTVQFSVNEGVWKKMNNLTPEVQIGDTTNDK